jgi:hypothetical protein
MSGHGCPIAAIDGMEWTCRLGDVVAPRLIGIALLGSLLQVAAPSAQLLSGAEPVRTAVPQVIRTPVSQDWSHRHLIFSAPATESLALELQQDIRYRHQWLERNRSQWRPEPVRPHVTLSPIPEASIHRDWGASLSAGGTVGDEMFPAKFSFDINAPPSCANDFVVYNTSLVGAAAHPSIIAYNQLYSTQGVAGGYCNQNGPSVMWSYKTNLTGDTTGITATSSGLSVDGTQVIYVETRPSASGGAILHILKWKSGQGTLAIPVAPDLIVTNWPACTAGKSCIVNITFNGAQPASNSAPFYDYTHDALYVGDDNGVLHKFTPVLSPLTTPKEVTTGGWPITVDSGAVLSSPVFDNGSGNIFVGDDGGQLSYVRDSASAFGSCATGSLPCLGTPSHALGGAIVDGPIVDSSTKRVFAFDGTDANNGSVYQFDTALSSASQVTVNVGGTGSGGSQIHAGTFDNTYLTSANGSGYLFVCGKSNVHNDRSALHRITITNGIMSSTSDGFLTLVIHDHQECSPVTEIFNTAASTDWLFFSVGQNASQNVAPGCSTTSGITGCLMSLDVTSATWPATAVNNAYPLPDAPAGGAGVTASSSGIVVDNVAPASTYPQASSIYFSFNGNGVTGAACNGVTGAGCAVKLTQSALQ